MEQGIRDLVDQLSSLPTASVPTPAAASPEPARPRPASAAAPIASASPAAAAPAAPKRSAAEEEEQIERHFGSVLDSHETVTPARRPVGRELDLNSSIAGIDLDGLLARLKGNTSDASPLISGGANGAKTGACLRCFVFCSSPHALSSPWLFTMHRHCHSHNNSFTR